jgi:hypothetical integral membrane protein (TIGR02206 family)
MKNFLLFETELPVDCGFELFGACHLIWLGIIGLSIYITGKWYITKNKQEQNRINQKVGLLLPVLGIYRDIILAGTGHYDIGFLPFHLCSMALWIALFYAWTNKEWLGVIYIGICLPGAVAALVFPNWEAYPLWNYMHIHSFLSHGLIVAFGVWQIWSQRCILSWKRFGVLVLFGVIGFIILYYVNLLLGTNFWFLNKPSHGSPLVWIASVLPDGWYLLGYFIFCVIIVSSWYSIVVQMQKKH